MKPWREIAVPHADVRKGAFQQSEFAADISAVHHRTAASEYQDAASFFERTYITEGMRLLLTQVMQRLSGQGGDPVIQLQTSFGGGKTHTMLAVLHLASRSCPLDDLPGIPSIVDAAGLRDVPKAKVAVLDGTDLSPGQPWTRGGRTIHTVWGELAWQLGGDEGYDLVRSADETGTSPGKDALVRLLKMAAPCVVLIDELVAYIRQFTSDKRLSGGDYGSNISFVQALTEAAKQVPTAVVLGSLPESEIEAGGEQGKQALEALEKTFGRIQALWKPVEIEESFEIVRRRLFEPITDTRGRDEVCRAFAETYRAEGSRLPTETQESRYEELLAKAYPIHPEVFARLYEDWSTIDGFQRTRGVLKLMAKVVQRLWNDQNQDAMIMPGSLPLSSGDVRNEMTYLLNAGWDAVISRDIDGEGAETSDLEQSEARFGKHNAARRVARTLFLGTAPPVGVTGARKARGLTRDRVLLGCLQPGQSSADFGDALHRLADRLHYLNASGDPTSDGTTFWFDTRANLRREMEDRRRRFDERTDVARRIEAVARKVFSNIPTFDGIHVFTPSSDVPDDQSLRLVVLDKPGFFKDDPKACHKKVLEYLREHGTQPRHRANRLLFIAADQATIGRLNEAVRTALAWESIVEDVKDGRLNIDQHQKRQAESDAKSSGELLPRIVQECYRWLLCPSQDDPRATSPSIEAFSLNTSGSSVANEIERVCNENELIIGTWAPIHLREQLKAVYWKEGRDYVRLRTFWDDSHKYLYLPRLRTRSSLEKAVQAGAGSRDFFGIAYGETDGHYDGFQFGGGNVAPDETLLLIEPGAAAAYEARKEAERRAATGDSPESGSGGGTSPESGSQTGPGTSGSGGQPGGGTHPHDPPPVIQPPIQKARQYRGAATVKAETAKSQLLQLADEIIANLTSDPTAEVRITLEIEATFPNGASDSTKRSVTENGNSLGLRQNEWE